MLTPKQTKERLTKINQIKVDEENRINKEKIENECNKAIATLLIASIYIASKSKKKKWYNFL